MDLLTRTLQRLQEIDPQACTPERAAHIEKQLRQEFGGREIYIKKRADSSQLIQSVLEQFTGNSTLACAKKMGVHRSTVYKYLKRQKARQLQPKTDDNRGKK